ncbi:MAG: type ISP restriction/modification enzyme [Thermodesulfobacteriota bacterium]
MTKRVALLKSYFRSLTDVGAHGDAREESYYSCLADLIREVALGTGGSDVQVTTLPKQTEAGNPDFRVWNGKDRIIGYIEAKKPVEENLNTVESSDQLKRYRRTFPNLILTNFCEFRLYRNGERIASVLGARPYVLNQLGAAPPVEQGEELVQLLDQFLGFSLPKAFTAESLAVELAKRTRFLRDVVTAELREEQRQEQGFLLGFYEAFQKYLIGDLGLEDFADLYAQTITYGLFAARTRAGDGFNRRMAFDHIPRTIGILRDVFQFVSLGELPKQLEWVVDDISEVLAVADAGGILDRFYHEGKGIDPIVHFYETFLAEYDPAERERRGVYYTPEPVVSYIVRSLHYILKDRFHRAEGLAARGVTLLDPAAGTMTFVARACQEAVGEFEQRYGKGGRKEFIRTHILKNFYAFELMMAPYAVGHLKMSFFLEELGHRLDDDERFLFYLTNTLEMEDLEQTRLPGMASLAQESQRAGEVKKQRPILVILGNPPYSGHSSNRGKWILRLIDDYKQVDGKPLGEKNPKWLQDDYVKFLRFAQWKIEQAGEGVVGMITNHSYLDNPTFRGMRRSLMGTFDEMYLLDLHGNSLKKETAPDGGKDQNVFDIRQGVAIALLIKSKGKKKSPAEVHHADLWGERQVKYDWLSSHQLKNTRWKAIHPRPDSYLFVPRDDTALKRYEGFTRLSEIFPVHSVGIVTARDSLTIHWTPEQVWTTVQNFSRLDPELARDAYKLGKDAKDWKVTLAQKDLKDSGPERKNIVPILYRPFDVRYTYYTGRSGGFHCRPRSEVMVHMLRENLGIIASKQFKEEPGAFVTKAIMGHKTVNVYDINYLFPLYLYHEKANPRKGALKGALMLFEPERPYETRTPNVSGPVMEQLSKALKKRIPPEDLFSYCYGVLYSSTYRTHYAQFLKTDFPRIPFAADFEVFQSVAALGKRMTGLHLLTSPELDNPAARFHGDGDNRVAENKSQGFLYDGGAQRVCINSRQYFAPIRPELWEYRIGGYQVLEKWLKDRRDRRLTLEEIKTYCRVATAVQRTIEIQAEIEESYALVEKRTL